MIETEKELVGKRVRLLKTIRNKGGDIFRRGTIMIINGKWSGWHMMHPRSKKSITRVKRSYFDVLICPLKIRGKLHPRTKKTRLKYSGNDSTFFYNCGWSYINTDPPIVQTVENPKSHEKHEKFQL